MSTCLVPLGAYIGLPPHSVSFKLNLTLTWKIRFVLRAPCLHWYFKQLLFMRTWSGVATFYCYNCRHEVLYILNWHFPCQRKRCDIYLVIVLKIHCYSASNGNCSFRIIVHTYKLVPSLLTLFPSIICPANSERTWRKIALQYLFIPCKYHYIVVCLSHTYSQIHSFSLFEFQFIVF